MRFQFCFYSNFSRPRFVPEHHLKSGQQPQIKTPVINTDHLHQQQHLNVSTTSQRPMSPGGPGGKGEEKKVRRISLIKNPRPLSPK